MNRNTPYLPYDFISKDIIDLSYHFKKNKDRAYEVLSGELQITLTVKKPLFAVREFKDIMPDGKSIPASSIRGMLRNVAEIIWNDQMSVLKDTTEKSRYVPVEWKQSETNIKNHGLVSHLFGFVSGEKDKTNSNEVEQHAENAFGSKLKFTDAKRVKTKYKAGANGSIKKHTLSAPASGQGFNVKYYKDHAKKSAAGQKVYLAGRIQDAKKKFEIEDRTAPPEVKTFFQVTSGILKDKEFVIYPGNQYTCKLRFSNVTNEELQHLVYLIELQQDRYHALGKAKPYGFGRVQLHVDSIKVIDKKETDFFNLSGDGYTATLDKKNLLENYHNPFEKKWNEFLQFANYEELDLEKAYATKTIKSVRYSLKGTQSIVNTIRNPKNSGAQHRSTHTAKRDWQGTNSQRNHEKKKNDRKQEFSGNSLADAFNKAQQSKSPTNKGKKKS